MKFDFNLGVIGFGNMAVAITQGIINNNTCKKDKILIYDIDIVKIAEAKGKGFITAEKITDIPLKCKYILMSVKPQSSENVFNDINDNLSDNIIITIMAGISKQKIHSRLKNVKICRCMPNTPALIGKGMTAIDTSELSEKEKKFILQIFSSVGNILEIEEYYMNAVTAVSGSGPAYVYIFIKSFIEAACKIGLNKEQAKMLVLSTIAGANEMINKSSEDISVLIDRVCSKGGTTIEGVKVLEEKKFENAVIECVAAANKRAEELSKI